MKRIPRSHPLHNFCAIVALTIFVAARTILPNLASSDDVMPSLVIKLANPYVAGLILAAPYGAVLSTVSGWLRPSSPREDAPVTSQRTL